jgi:hypothetical protein
LEDRRPSDFGSLEQGGVMKRKSARAYLDGFGAVQSVLDLDVLTVQEVVEALDMEREDPFVNPWKRGHKAAMRSILGR